MFRRFNDISIRGKLIVIVAGAVAVLTTAVLISVWVSARREVNADVATELQFARQAFITSEGEHLHEHALEAGNIAADDDLLPLMERKDSSGACAWSTKLLSGKNTAQNFGDKVDLVALVLPDHETLSIAVAGQPPCGAAQMKWHLRPLTNTKGLPEITNWECKTGAFYELIEAPVFGPGPAHKMMGTFIMGYEVSDLFALHIKEHTLQDNIVWHKDAATSHLLGSSDPSLKSLLEPVMANGGINDEATVNGHRILHASIEDDKDVLLNPEGLHIDLVASLDAKLQAFRKLEYSLALMAFITLLLGFMVGLWLSRPIADPLVSLANAADCVARGQLNVADDMMLRHPQRLHAKDEIGVLGRSFLRMVQGLKERLAMSTFLSEATYQHIKRNAQDEFASERTSLAILFADVRQFSNFAETRDPEAVIQLLNQVLSIEAEIVKKHGGDIDKFVGDALVAWFSGQDRCQRAIHAATEMMSALQARFNGEPGTKIGAGIHVGDVVVGSIGSSARKDYTAIGAVVNMAARLCSNAHPGQVLVSEAVRAELGENANLNPLPPISLKGFSEPVPVFEVMTGKAVGA